MIHPRPKIVEILLNQEDIQVNIQNNTGSTPLYLASLSIFTGILNHLLEHRDITINVPTYEGNTPLSAAASGNHSAALQALLNRA